MARKSAAWLHRRGSVLKGDFDPNPHPWVPRVLDGFPPEMLLALTYVQLDEQEANGELSFVLSHWPRLDDLGRVRHSEGEDDDVDVGVASDEWVAMLSERRLPEVLRDRAPHIGDTFAMMLTRRTRGAMLDPVGPVYDVTADARDAAKAAFFGAVSQPLADEVRAEVEEAEPPHQGEHLAPPQEWADHLAARS